MCGERERGGMCCPVASTPWLQHRGGTSLLMANEPAGGLLQLGSAAGEGEVFATAPLSESVSCTRDSRLRCPAPPRLMDSVRRVKARAWTPFT